ncbi:CRISPR system precrRNA processing endoribonuclease RAMP protein Cas6 [Anaerolineales bacterium HSG6]|nr:CRISPR system precrRNA processing endoribonuclease RAMP protein Cas6 [Anaerolineales bacterium HSG6]
MTNFTVLNLQFTVQVQETIKFNEFKGSALRGAWQNHLRTLYCSQRGQSDPLHQAICPVCFLLNVETQVGNTRRPYSLQPPLTKQLVFEPDSQFSFGMSLFGFAQQHLLYMVLAVTQMGETQGVGTPIHPHKHGKKRGCFRMKEIKAINPLTQQTESLFNIDEGIMKTPTLIISQSDVDRAYQQWLSQLAAQEYRLTLQFDTPTQLNYKKQKRVTDISEFSALFSRLYDRQVSLQEQYAHEKEPERYSRKKLLMGLADQVQLVDNQTRFWNLHGHSNRQKQRTRLSGLVGEVTYQAEPEVWQKLLPWLIWGQVIQVGQNVVKGCGVYRINDQ